MCGARASGSALTRLWLRVTGLFSRALSMKFVLLIVVVELIFGTLLGLVVSLYSIQSAAEERRDNLRHVSSVIAASVMPLVADQDSQRIQAQLNSLLHASEVHDLECIRIVDSSGRVVAESAPGCTCDAVQPATSILSAFTRPQVIEQPISIGGAPVAVAEIQFQPVGLEKVLTRPLKASATIVAAVVLISALWVAWLMMRHVAEPIGDLRDAAALIASGRRDLELTSVRRDEIGQLSVAIDDMMRQLADQEERLMDSYRSLESAYQLQAEAREDLQRSMRMKSDFVAVASHELRSPLAVIQLYSEMLQAGEYGGLKGGAFDAVQSVVAATRRLGSIVGNLMDVALLERGLMPLEYGDLRLDELVSQAAHDASLLGDAKGVPVALVGPVPQVELRGDGVRLRQVLDNLLSNAVKYSEAGRPVEIEAQADDVEAVIRIVDGGRGIPPKKRAEVFELFSRVDTKDNADKSGLGLGLAISARIAEAHGGSIVIEDNDRGGGSVFVLRLPLRRTESVEAEHSSVRVV